MAYITFDISKLKSNLEYLENLFQNNNIKWAVVTKLLSGNKLFLNELLKFNIKQVADSRVSNLRAIKRIKPNIETIYIKPPAKSAIPGVVKYADISMNTEIKTIQLLSREAQKQNKTHKVIIMIELGDLREGVMGDDFVDFYRDVFKLKGIEVAGIGSNLSCFSGVLPNQDKLIQLSLYKELIEAKFNRKINFVSGGSSVTINLILQKLLPRGINHFRIGESIFLGTDVYNNSVIDRMKSNVFKLYAEIIELIDKPMYPIGEIGTNVEGKSATLDEDKIGQSSNRAIIDIGLLDAEIEHMELSDKSLNFVGASSDMIVIDLHHNKNNYKVGDLIEIKLDYMAILRVMNSRYIDKKIINEIN
ncbi:MAG: alanine/ornithine racemase family PLP-dependent enzyme [Bacteroidales bacterium]|jgi:predicted amino acid racemase|nr:alanine/ornithine racemase family PLP-dependent enzyme [Bacteroidales bacterium]